MRQRSIKFRAWDIEKKKWISLIDLFEKETIPVILTEKGFKLKDRFILCQWTGLIDIEANEIYEGDIVQCNFNLNNVKKGMKLKYKGKIEFCGGIYKIISIEDKEGLKHREDYLHEHTNEIKVINTIFGL